MKIFRFFGKLIGALLVPVLILSIFLSIFALAFTTQLFNPDFFLEIFEEEDFFDQLPGIAATQIHYSMTFNPCLEDPLMCEDGEPSDEGETESEGGGPPSYFQALSEEDWETLLTEVLPPDWLENQLHDLVHNLIDSIRSGSEELTLGISLLELKEHLTGTAGVEAISQLLKNQPECTQEDLLDMTRILEGNDDSGKDFLSCNPGNDFLDNYIPQFESLLRRSLTDIPEEIDFGKGLKGKSVDLKILGEDLPLTVVINFGRWMVLISPLLICFLLLGIATLAVHTFRALRVWWGYPIAIAGLLATGLASLAGPAADFLLDRFLGETPLAGLHMDLVDTATSLGLKIIYSLFSQARTYALVVTGIGLTVIIVASVLRRPHKKLGKDEPIPDDDLGEADPQEGDQDQTAPPGSGETEQEEEQPKEKQGKKKKKKEDKVEVAEEENPDQDTNPETPPEGQDG